MTLCNILACFSSVLEIVRVIGIHGALIGGPMVEESFNMLVG